MSTTNYPGSPSHHVDENPQEVFTSVERAPGTKLVVSISKECPSDQPGMYFSHDGWLTLELYTSYTFNGQVFKEDEPTAKFVLSPDEVALLIEVFRIKGVLGVLATATA